jgi:hypothetical protein
MSRYKGEAEVRREEGSAVHSWVPDSFAPGYEKG